MSEATHAKYIVRSAVDLRSDDADWDDRAWAQADIAEIDHFHASGSSHRPHARAKLLCDVAGLHLLFRVDDHYVRSRYVEYQSPVCRDSCVEFFVEPRPDRGYLNFEFNAGGTLHLSYVEDPQRTPKGFKKFTPVPAEWGQRVKVKSSLPETVEPELPGPVMWTLRSFIPWTLIEKFVGPVRPVAGAQWRGNFYKCGDETSHPHWAAWSPIGKELNFHQPKYFGELHFAAS